MGRWKARRNDFSDFVFAKYGKVDEALKLIKKPHWETDEDHV